MKTYLFDSNHASRLLRQSQNQSLRQKIDSVGEERFLLCTPMVAELYFMVFNSTRAEENLKELERSIAGFRVIPFGLPAAEEYGRIRAALRRHGKPIPPIDVQIAAVARVHGLTVLTADKHFNYVPDLHVENWMA